MLKRKMYEKEFITGLYNNEIFNCWEKGCTKKLVNKCQ